MFEVTETIIIGRSPADVFDFLTNGQNRPLWDSSVVFEEPTSPPPVGPGSTMRTVMRVMGREVEFEWRVERLERPTLMAIVSTSGPMATSFALAFATVDGSCEVTAGMRAEPTGMMRLVEPVIQEAVRGNLSAGLARAKAVLEASTA